MVLQVVHDAAARAHARAGKHHPGAGLACEGPRIGGLLTHCGRAEIGRQFAGPPHGLRLVVEQLGMRLVDLGGADGHRAVEKNRERLQRPALEGAGEQVQQELRPADANDGHEDPPALCDSRLHRFPRGQRRFGQRRMFPVAVGRFHEHEVGVLEGHGIAMQWCAAWPDVTGEHDDLPGPVFFNGDLETRRAEDVTGLDGADADAGRDSGRVVVAQPAIEGLKALDVLWRVERRDRGLAALLASAVLPRRVLALEVCRILQDQIGQCDRRRRGVDRSAVVEARQQRQATRVIEVRVRQDDGVKTCQCARLSEGG